MSQVATQDRRDTKTSDRNAAAERWMDDRFPARKIKRVLFITLPDVDVSLFSFDTATQAGTPTTRLTA